MTNWTSVEIQEATWKTWLGATGAVLCLTTAPIVVVAMLMGAYPVPVFIVFFSGLYLFVRSYLKKPRTVEDNILGAMLLLIVLLLFLLFCKIVFYGTFSVIGSRWL